MENPLVQAIFAAFPEAKFEDIRTAETLTKEARAEALPEVEDEWDPFEDN
jgi:DNA polymerase-3 subunit gamma/tau